MLIALREGRLLSNIGCTSQLTCVLERHRIPKLPISYAGSTSQPANTCASKAHIPKLPISYVGSTSQPAHVLEKHSIPRPAIPYVGIHKHHLTWIVAAAVVAALAARLTVPKP
jgi:hypothetical protein